MVVVKFLCVCKSPCCAFRPTQALYMQRSLLSTAAGFFPSTVRGTFLLPPVCMYCNAVERKGPVVGAPLSDIFFLDPHDITRYFVN